MLGEDAGIKHTLNRYARRAAVGAVDSYGETALNLVSDTIRGWDAKTITDRLDNAVGDDLQSIRINGTPVGGPVGVLFHRVDVLLSRPVPLGKSPATHPPRTGSCAFHARQTLL